eukprot:40803-Alexandrium_andersonii.AAC.1
MARRMGGTRAAGPATTQQNGGGGARSPKPASSAPRNSPEGHLPTQRRAPSEKGASAQLGRACWLKPMPALSQG